MRYLLLSILILVAFTLTISITIPASAEPYWGNLKVDIEKSDRFEGEKSDIIRIKAEFTNNDDEQITIHHSFVLLEDLKHREFSHSSYFTLRDKGHDVTERECPFDFSVELNPGISEDTSLCYEVPKENAQYILHLYETTPDWCKDPSFGSCNEKTVRLTNIPSPSPKSTVPKTELIPTPSPQSEIEMPNISSLTKYENKEFGFSIDYPTNWYTDDSIITDGATVESFFVKSDLENYDSLMFVQLVRDFDYSLTTQQILNTEKSWQKQTCDERDSINDGFTCYDFEFVKAENREKNGREEYAFVATWIEDWFGTEIRGISFLLLIPDGKDMWRIAGETTSNFSAEILPDAINSFTITNPNSPTILKQIEQKIPDWIKNNAKWWSEGQIDDTSFVSGIQFLIKEKIINVSSTTNASSPSSENIPSWVKTNAGWWADDMITEDEFVKGIEFLVNQGIVKIQ